VSSDPSPHPLLPAPVQARYRELGHWTDTTVAEVVRDWAVRDPDRPAIRGHHPLTYGELWERSNRLAGALADAGLEPGEFVVAVLPNCWQGVVLTVATSIAGAALSPLSARVSPTLAVNIFDQVGARGLILESARLEREDWRAALGGLRRRLKGRPVMLQGDAIDGGERLPTLERATLEGPELAPRSPDPGRPSLVLSTGGTTGHPKSVLHCDNTMLYAARGYASACELSADDVLVAFGPYGHASGSVFEILIPLVQGASLLPNSRWQARSVAEAIARWGGTVCITVGTHMYDLLALEPGSEPLLGSMRVVASGAGPENLFDDAERRFGFKVIRGYGLSECLGHARGRPSDPPGLRLCDEGVPFSGVEGNIVDPDGGQALPAGAVGEYLCRAPSLFMGYHGQPELTAAVVTDDGFYRTGDLMVRDAAGRLRWSGRLKDVIRRGGLQIDVIEMESILATHPKVAEVAVVGEPDPRLGERAVAVVVPISEGDPPELAELVEHLTIAGLSKESLPERVLVSQSLPLTERGKVQRVELKKWVAGSRGHPGLVDRGKWNSSDTSETTVSR
jgi:acyl-CoA synthetase (AMP-forming)/AMP-acid ligase II